MAIILLRAVGNRHLPLSHSYYRLPLWSCGQFFVDVNPNCKVKRLVELHLWPATPQSPRVAFTMELLDIIHAAMLECQVFLHHASGMLQYLSALKMVSKIFLEKFNI